jgi:hypothetical protein
MDGMVYRDGADSGAALVAASPERAGAGSPYPMGQVRRADVKASLTRYGHVCPLTFPCMHRLRAGR